MKERASHWDSGALSARLSFSSDSLAESLIKLSLQLLEGCCRCQEPLRSSASCFFCVQHQERFLGLVIFPAAAGHSGWVPSSHFCSAWSCVLATADWCRDESLVNSGPIRGPYQEFRIGTETESHLPLWDEMAGAEDSHSFYVVGKRREETSLQGERRMRHMLRYKRQREMTSGFPTEMHLTLQCACESPRLL